ncbi:hypothetical protein OY671_008667, partial [Metschnikowia pulcherrima]
QTLDPLELAQITRDDDEAAAAGMACNQQVIASDHSSSPFERCANISGMIGGFGIERQHFEPRRKTFHLSTMMFRPRGLGGAMQEFRENDGGDAQALRAFIEQRA